jgi:hypothetical protein
VETHRGHWSFLIKLPLRIGLSGVFWDGMSVWDVLLDSQLQDSLLTPPHAVRVLPDMLARDCMLDDFKGIHHRSSINKIWNGK